LPAPSQGDHEPVPQPGTVYSWHNMPSDGRSMTDFPLQAVCTCGERAIRPDWRSPWRHRAGGEVINEPADAEF
jgi:hypothetical protein